MELTSLPLTTASVWQNSLKSQSEQVGKKV